MGCMWQFNKESTPTKIIIIIIIRKKERKHANGTWHENCGDVDSQLL